MYSLRLVCDIDEKDELVAELHAAGTSGILEKEEPGGACRLDAFFDTAAQARSAAGSISRFRPRLIPHSARDYVAEFRQHWRPLRIGKRIWLVPPWQDGAPPGGRVRVDFQPGMACGSGAHPCTQLCLRALDEHLRPGDAVLDVGAGSGILLLAARALGAKGVAGCEIDAETIAAAPPGIPYWIGSTDSVRTRSFDLVIANISSLAASELREELERISRRVIVVSGFRGDELPPGYDDFRQTQQSGWIALTRFRPPSSGPPG